MSKRQYNTSDISWIDDQIRLITILAVVIAGKTAGWWTVATVVAVWFVWSILATVIKARREVAE